MVSRAFLEGYQARYKGKQNCPYRVGTKRYEEWYTGYGEAGNDIREGR